MPDNKKVNSLITPDSSNVADEDYDDFDDSDNDDQESDVDSFAEDADEEQENDDKDNGSKVIFVDLNAPKKPKNQTVFMDSGRKKSSPKKLDTIIVYD